MLVQTEIERVKFVVRSYIRTRLHKVRSQTHLKLKQLLICVLGGVDREVCAIH